MPNNEGSGEPGLTLSRMIAAERNALAGIESARLARIEIAAAMTRIAQLEGEVVAMKADAERMRGILALSRGTGPTVKG